MIGGGGPVAGSALVLKIMLSMRDERNVLLVVWI